jgi:hypothetical protein
MLLDIINSQRRRKIKETLKRVPKKREAHHGER